MATDGGPNIERDGLVFGMDTGYGVANNSTSTRFYKGKPTVNYVPGTYGYGMYAYASGPVDDTAQNENGQVVPVKRYTIYQASNTARAAIRPDTNTTDYHTFSFKWKYNGTTTTSPSISVSAAKGNPEGGANNNGFEYQTGDTISIGNNWYLSTYTFKFSSNPTGKCILTFGINTGSNQSYLGETFDIYEAQFELNDRVTPFVNGTRSPTQSLIDLTKSTDIDVSNVSFDSTGQPTFDGTNDYFVTDNSFLITGDQTWEVVAMANGGPDSPAGILTNHHFQSPESNFGINYVSGNRLGASIGYTNGSREYASKNTSYVIQIGVPFHAVLKYDSSNNTIEWFINGESDSTYSLSATPNFISQQICSGRWTPIYNDYYFNGEVYVGKVYGRALTPDEIRKNYKAYKNRFNL